MLISDWSSDVCSSDLRLLAHERHINTLLDSVPADVILTWVLLAATVNDIGTLLWGTLVGYLIESAWLLWLASRGDGMWGRPRLCLSSHLWPELVKAAGVMPVGQLAIVFVGPLHPYNAST